MKAKRYSDLHDTEKDVLSAVADFRPLAGYIVQSKPMAIYGLEKNYDEEAAKRLSIDSVKLGFAGGTIVESAGDVGFVLFDRLEEQGRCLESIKESLLAFLKGHGLNADVNKNDITVDGYKTVAITWRNVHDTKHNQIWNLMAVQISINVDLEAIKAICTKPMIKTPKGLSEYGITTEEVEQWLEKWIEENFSK